MIIRFLNLLDSANGYASVLVIFISLASCTNPVSQNPEKLEHKESLFRLLEPAQTNIDFVNHLPESAHMNRFIYEYFYNGGGVAIGDVNGDDLVDIYFTSNLEANKLYLNRGNLQFEDITNKSGVAGKKGWATGVTIVDINQDELLDIYVCRAGRFKNPDQRKNELFINQGIDDQGKPTFKELANRYGLDVPSFSNQASFFDYDKDGDLDVFLANHNIEAPPNDIESIERLRSIASPLGGNKMLKNENGKFVDVTKQAGISSHMMNYTLAVSVGDINQDGWPDIYVTNDYSEPDHLYLNQKDGSFQDVISSSIGQMPNFSMGCDMADINNDGNLDLMTLDMVAADNYGIKTSMSGMNVELFNAHVRAGLHYQYMYNALQLNNGNDENGNPLFSNIAQFAGVSSTDWSWAPLIADFDNDGFQDLFISNGVKRDFRNNDFNLFLRDASQEVVDKKKNPLDYYKRWTQLSPTREKANYLFRNNNGDLSFADKSGDWGLDQLSFSNGAAYGDLDNDGDLDLVVNNVDSAAFVYENNSNEFSMNGYLTIKLLGPSTNKFGVGARVTVNCNNDIQVREQMPTRGYQSSVSEVLHFGLGDNSIIDELRIVWLDGKAQILSHVMANQQLLLDYKNAESVLVQSGGTEDDFFFEIWTEFALDDSYKENPFNDFERESLLPHKLSQLGPALSIGDINNDNLDDFYLGGAMGQPGKMYLQQNDGSFQRKKVSAFDLDRQHEDVESLLFDADGDNDLDLYVVSGSNEEAPGNEYYRDRFYQNESGEMIKKSEAIPAVLLSGGCVVAQDYDNDGDLDLFVGGRQIPGKYPSPPSSYIFKNESNSNEIKFTDVSSSVAPSLKNIGM
ncbi:MAG: VCBS repeat-containing protein [Cyclobacteriaceae bacterium]